jgi:hypothetical protein
VSEIRPRLNVECAGQSPCATKSARRSVCAMADTRIEITAIAQRAK